MGGDSYELLARNSGGDKNVDVLGRKTLGFDLAYGI